nr:hypothetical protein [Flavobacterium sp. 140616W15]
MSIVSLYGKNNKPSGEQLKGIDVMILIYRMWDKVIHIRFYNAQNNGSMCRE